MKMFSPKFKTAMFCSLFTSSALVLLSLGSTVSADETKGGNAPGAITSTAPGPDNDVQYSTDHFTGISIAGKEVQLWETATKLPPNSAVALERVCDYVNNPDGKTPQKPNPKSGEPCDHQDQTAKIYEAAAKAMGIPGAYLMCGMIAVGGSLDSDKANTLFSEMKQNKLKYQTAWRAFQKQMNPTQDDSSVKSYSTVTTETLVSSKQEDFESRIFGLAMAYRDTLQPSSDAKVTGLDVSTIKGEVGSVEVMNYMIDAQKNGIKDAMDDLKKAGNEKQDGHTDMEKCISKVNGIPLSDNSSAGGK